MITPEEREEIIQEALERILRVLPETIGNLMKSQALYQKLTESFYKDNPEFKKHTDIVREVIAKVESSNPTKDYENILKEAIPKIRDMIKTKDSLSMSTPDKVSNNGAL